MLPTAVRLFGSLRKSLALLIARVEARHRQW